MSELKMPVRVLRAWDYKTEKLVPVLVDGDYDGEYLAQFKWTVLRSGHVASATKVDGVKREYLARLVASPGKGYYVWHKNRNLLDNRSENLENITARERALRRRQGSARVFSKRRDNNGTGFSNVYFSGTKSKKNPYYVIVCGKYRGMFQTAEKAARAADKIRVGIYGYESIKNLLNFPEDWRENE